MEFVDAQETCEAGRCTETIGLLEQALAHGPSDVRLFYWLGICYGGCCRRHALTAPDMAAAYLRRALTLAPSHDRVHAEILDQLGNALTQSSPRPESLRAAVECHRQSAEVYAALGMAREWTRVEFNLGNSCCELSELGESRWREAILHYQRSLAGRIRRDNPEACAAVLENLGTAYRHVAGGDRQALVCYRRALAVYRRARYPEQHAALHNNLGNVFLSLAETEPAAAPRHLRRAIRHFGRALAACDPRSRLAGIAQYNCAQAYFRLAGGTPDGLGRAAACLKAAMAAFEACGEERYLALIRRQLESHRLPA